MTAPTFSRSRRPVSPLAAARTQPGFFDAFLKAYRSQTPRPTRQAMVDGLDVSRALEHLAAMPLAERARRYVITVYLAAAQALQTPLTPEVSAQRQAFLVRMGGVFGLPVRAVADDLRRMMARLRWDHAAWLRHQEGLARRVQRVVAAPANDGMTSPGEAIAEGAQSTATAESKA